MNVLRLLHVRAFHHLTGINELPLVLFCNPCFAFKDKSLKTAVQKKRKEETREALYGLGVRDCLVPNLQVKVQNG